MTTKSDKPVALSDLATRILSAHHFPGQIDTTPYAVDLMLDAIIRYDEAAEKVERASNRINGLPSRRTAERLSQIGSDLVTAKEVAKRQEEALHERIPFTGQGVVSKLLLIAQVIANQAHNKIGPGVGVCDLDLLDRLAISTLQEAGRLERRFEPEDEHESDRPLTEDHVLRGVWGALWHLYMERDSQLDSMACASISFMHHALQQVMDRREAQFQAEMAHNKAANARLEEWKAAWRGCGREVS